MQLLSSVHKITQEFISVYKNIVTSIKQLKNLFVGLYKNINLYIVNNNEITLIVFVIIGSVLLGLLRLLNFFSFNITAENYLNILGTLIESLTGIFAIVFSISLVTIERYSEEHSKLITSLYFDKVKFFVPFLINIFSILINLYLYFCSDIALKYIDYSVISVFSALLSLCIFFLYTIRFLTIENVVVILLNRIKINDF